ncbi:MAG: type II secretion system inner membrane protein GspF [Pseudomonadales bacterium]
MAAFDYVALDSQGRKQKGSLEADSARQMRQLLRDRGLTPLSVDESSQKQRREGSLKSLLSPHISIADLALLTRQLATLVQAALPLEEALSAAAQQTTKPKVRSMLLAVRAKVMEGHTLANALSEFPRAFPAIYRATVAAGEKSGFLDQILNRLADYTEASHESRQKIMMALLYPVILLVLSLLIVTGLMVYIVPDVVEVFIDTGQQLPTLTVALIAVSDFIAGYGLYLLIALIAAGFGLRYLLKQPAIRLAWHRRLLKLPLVGRLSITLNTARFASTLSILTTSGVPLVEAMRISGQVLSNLWLKQLVEDATRKVTEGSSLHRALQQSGYFPPMMVHMIASGEASGELDQMLERVAASQEREVQNFIGILLGLFEPLMLLAMGLTVLLIVLAILLPILNLNQLVT